MIDTLDRVARAFILPLNDKSTDVEVYKSRLTRNLYIVEFMNIDFLTAKERQKCIDEMKSLFNMLSPQEEEKLHVTFKFGI